MTRLARSLIATTAVLMLPTAACADGLTSSHVTGNPVMQIRPTSSNDDLAGSINLGPNAGGTVMTVTPQGGSADPNLSSNAGNGVMMVNPTGSATPTTGSNAGGGVAEPVGFTIITPLPALLLRF